MRCSSLLPVALALMLPAPLPAQTAPRAPLPEFATDPGRCEWHWMEGAGAGHAVGVWTERCSFETGAWALEWSDALPGFVQTVDGAEVAVAVRILAVPAGAPIEAILPRLRAEGMIPDDAGCVFAPTEFGAPSPTRSLLEIVPVGARLAALEATPAGEVPEPPCGDYGWSPEGVRYFLTDSDAPGAVLYVDVGQDGRLFDEASIRLRPAP